MYSYRPAKSQAPYPAALGAKPQKLHASFEKLPFKNHPYWLGTFVIVCLLAAITLSPHNSTLRSYRNKAAPSNHSTVTVKTVPATSAITTQPYSSTLIPTKSSVPVPAPSASTKSSTSPSHTSASLTVNGKPIPIPKNGYAHKVINTPQGRTDVDIDISSSSNDSGQNSSSMTVQVNSVSTSP